MPSAMPLTLSDLQARAPAAPQVVAKMRDSHHQLARLVADGQKVIDIALITGYSPEHIHRLESDPAFQELVAHYKSVVEVKYINMHERIAGLGSDTIQEIHERLRDKPDEFTISGLTELAKLTLDRSGFGPTKTVNQNSISAQVTPDDLARIRAAHSSGGVRQIGQKTAETIPPKAPDRLDESDIIDLTPVVHTESETERVEGPGHPVRENLREIGPARVRPGPSLS